MFRCAFFVLSALLAGCGAFGGGGGGGDGCGLGCFGADAPAVVVTVLEGDGTPIEVAYGGTLTLLDAEGVAAGTLEVRCPRPQDEPVSAFECTLQGKLVLFDVPMTMRTLQVELRSDDGRVASETVPLAWTTTTPQGPKCGNCDEAHVSVVAQ